MAANHGPCVRLAGDATKAAAWGSIRRLMEWERFKTLTSVPITSASRPVARRISMIPCAWLTVQAKYIVLDICMFQVADKDQTFRQVCGGAQGRADRFGA
jgi:hypothetical protein